MASVIEFSSRSLVEKDVPIPGRVTPGKLIEFPKPKSVNNLENEEIRKPDRAGTAALFFGCF